METRKNPKSINLCPSWPYHALGITLVATQISLKQRCSTTSSPWFIVIH